MPAHAPYKQKAIVMRHCVAMDLTQFYTCRARGKDWQQRILEASHATRRGETTGLRESMRDAGLKAVKEVWSPPEVGLKP